MAFNVEYFASELGRTGVARASHFMFVINLPNPTTNPGIFQNEIGQKFKKIIEDRSSGLEFFSTEYASHLALRCDRVSMPGRIVVSSPYKEGNMGLVREYPTNAVYQPVDASFILSKNLEEKVFFEAWQDLIVGHHRTDRTEFESKSLNYLGNFTTSCDILQFEEVPQPDSQGILGFKGIYKIELKEAYPRTIQDMQADWASSEIQRLNVVFDYKFYQDEIIGQVDKRFANTGRVPGQRFGTASQRSAISKAAPVLAGAIADRAGLTQRQTAFLTGAASAAYGLWNKINPGTTKVTGQPDQTRNSIRTGNGRSGSGTNRTTTVFTSP
tara:strand:+ start:599 stop:1579 length:981 start_codon:yes stop_codon:yes gene_type:complete